MNGIFENQLCVFILLNKIIETSIRWSNFLKYQSIQLNLYDLNYSCEHRFERPLSLSLIYSTIVW